MKKMYLSTAVVLSALITGLTAATTTANTGAAGNGVTDKNGQSSQKPLRKIFLLNIEDSQRAFDDATGFVAISPAKRTICFSEQGGIWKGGYVVTPSMQPGLPNTICQIINPKGGLGQAVLDVNAIKIPVATQYFGWKPGSQTNPDEWYTPNGQIPTDNVYGVCTISDTGDIGLAIRGVDKPHQCVLTNRSVPLNDQSILVLVK